MNDYCVYCCQRLDNRTRLDENGNRNCERSGLPHVPVYDGYSSCD